MHNSRLKRISLAVCFALMPIAAGAAGLGKLTVFSGLGEPLSAEVELLSTSSEEISSLSAQIAPNEVFVEQGIERASTLSAVRIEVGKRPDGTPVLRLSSPQPINDPFLDMLIQVEWSSGRLLREYTALLDPPGFGDQAATSAAALPSVASEQVSDVPGSASEMVSGKIKGRRSAAAPIKPDAGMAPADEAGSHTTKKGDTLHAIAKQMQVEGVSLEQMLVGLYRANQDAFVGNNMNRLKVGQVVHLPEQEELQAIGQSEALKEIRVQTADWNAYRNKLAGMVAESASAKEEPSSQVVSGKITAPAEDKSAMPDAGPHDVVKLSKSETGGVAAKTGVADVAGRLSALQEEATAREKAIKESGERVASLEKQLQDMQKLLEIKNKSLADAQKTAKAPEPIEMEPAKPAPPAAPASTVEPVPPAKVAEPAPEPEKPATEKKPEAPKPEAGGKKPKRVVHPAPPPSKPEPGMFDAFLENPLLLAGGGGLLALIGGGWFYLRNKRKKGLDSFEQGILTSGGAKPNTVFGNTAGGTVDTGNTSFLADFGQGAAAGMIDTSEVDPIAEAEVYMAYGRDVQAEEILKDAIAKEPRRYELHLKLLEIFATRKDTGSFETLAGELYAALGATDPTWARVAEMGRKLEPDNPLYSESTSGPIDFGATMIQQPPAASSDEAAGDMDIGLGGGADTTLDFSLDEPTAEASQTPTEVSVEGSTLDFDIGGLESPAEAPSMEVTEEQLAEPSLDTGAAALDLDIPSLQESNVEPALDVPEVAAEQEIAGMDFQLDLPEPAAAGNSEVNPADLGLGIEDELMKGSSPEAASSDIADDTVEASLDLPALDVVEAAAEIPSSQEASALELDLSALDAIESGPAFEGESEAQPAALDMSPDQSAAMEEISLDLPEEGALAEPVSLDVDFGEALEVPAVVEEAAEGASGLDFNFDVDLGESAPQEDVSATTAAAQLPDLDLSDISLNVDEGVAIADAGTTEDISLTSSESSEVDTKLDLITAYLDMGDQEGARELLQEVLKEGGPIQIEKAQKLLDGLG